MDTQPLHPVDYGTPGFTVYEGKRPSLYEAERIQAEIDRIENLALHYRREARKARVWAWFMRIIDGDGFFLVTGAIAAFDLCLVIALVRS